MAVKKREETEGRKHNPARVRACIEEYERLMEYEEIYASATKFYNWNTDILGKWYPTFYDYYMEHNKTCTDKHYYEIWKDKQGNRQAIMYPYLDDYDNIVYRVRDPHHDISDTICIGHEEPAEQEEVDGRTSECISDIVNKFRTNKRK